MSEGPTTAGSIVGKLSIDKSQWDRDKAEAKKDAAELGALNPTIKVEANVGDALAKMEAVRAAQEKLGFATDRLKIAYQKLDEVQTKGGASESRLMGLHASAARAESAHEAATRGLAAAQKDLAAGEDEVDNSNKKVAQSQGVTLNRTMLIAAAIAALIPLLAPLAGYAVGVAGALAGMGAAGVLALFGIHDAMQSATSAGMEWSAGLGQLKDDLGQLASTAAMALLHDFSQAVALVSKEMPTLNDQIATFGNLLGTGVMSVIRGVITSFNVMNPLFVRAAVYVDQLAAGFQSWTQDGGLSTFVQYAITALPVVAQTLGSLATASLHLIEAFAPLGTVVLQALTALGVVINALPVNVLMGVTVAALAGFGAFKLWGTLVPILGFVEKGLLAVGIASERAGFSIGGVAKAIGAVGVATEVAEGPIGWVIAGVSALAAVLAVGSIATAQATQATVDYTTALNADNDAIGTNVRAQAAKSLQDAGALDAAQKLGISTKDLTDAVLGNAAALARVHDVIDPLTASLDAAAKKQGQLTGAQAAQADASSKVVGALKSQSQGLKDTIAGAQQLAGATGGLSAAQADQVTQTGAVASALGLTADQFEALTQKEDGAKTATDLLKQSLDLLNGKSLSAAQAQNAFDSAIANSDKHVDATGKTINRANTALTGMTAAAVKNRGELIQQSQAAETNAQAFRDAGGSATATKQKLIDMKAAIIANAIAHGEDTAQVHAFVDQIYKIPKSIPPTKIEVDDAAALAKLAQFEAAVARATNTRTLTLAGTAGAVTSASGKAYGGTIGMSSGGSVHGPGSASSDTAGLYRLANGEEVISNIRGQADKWRPQLKDINAGRTPQFAGGSSVSKSVVNNFYITEATNGAQLAQQVANRQNAHAV